MELYIKDTCESAILTTLHPVSTVSINVQELQDCGGVSWNLILNQLFSILNICIIFNIDF